MLNGFLHFALRGPNIGKKNRFAILSCAEWIFAQIHVHASGERKGHDQWRRHQIVGSNIRIDAALEVSVPREHRSDHQVLAVNFFRNFLRQRPGVSNAGGAAVANDVEFQLLEIRCQASTF